MQCNATFRRVSCSDVSARTSQVKYNLWQVVKPGETKILTSPIPEIPLPKTHSNVKSSPARANHERCVKRPHGIELLLQQKGAAVEYAAVWTVMNSQLAACCCFGIRVALVQCDAVWAWWSGERMHKPSTRNYTQSLICIMQPSSMQYAYYAHYAYYAYYAEVL